MCILIISEANYNEEPDMASNNHEEKYVIFTSRLFNNTNVIKFISSTIGVRDYHQPQRQQQSQRHQYQYRR